MTGSRSISSRISMKSLCWLSRSSCSASVSCSAVLAKIILRIIGSRCSSRNICSVRHSPIPSAPLSRATLASVAVSALARMASSRISSAHWSKTSISGIGSTWVVCIAPRITSPEVPSIESVSPTSIRSPLMMMWSSASSMFSAPQTAGLPQPRATTAA